MKKYLLLAVAALMVSTASAQLKPAYQNKVADAKEKLTQLKKHAPAHQLDFSQVSTMKEMKSGDALAPSGVKKAPQKAGYLAPWYRRPAGMYCSPFIVADGGKGLYSYGNYAFLMNKPFAEFTWEGSIGGMDENTSCAVLCYG